VREAEKVEGFGLSLSKTRTLLGRMPPILCQLSWRTLIGVVAALLLSGRPLGFVAILGILALFGMITKNAVILVGQIDFERAQGNTVWQAAIDASSSRFRPIMLTAVSTVLGMTPIAPTVFWDRWPS
jgi:multidrug efflux pump subunit AcrB